MGCGSSTDSSNKTNTKPAAEKTKAVTIKEDPLSKGHSRSFLRVAIKTKLGSHCSYAYEDLKAALLEHNLTDQRVYTAVTEGIRVSELFQESITQKASNLGGANDYSNLLTTAYGKTPIESSYVFVVDNELARDCLSGRHLCIIPYSK